MKKPSISLIISTYNRPDALEACLESVRRQKLLPVEVIIADDGSTDDTKETIARIQRQFPVPIHHVWQEDRGFRLAKIRNKAIAIASGEYVIQTDGDIIMHPMFTADHARFARHGCYVKGVRVKLGRRYSDFICKNPTVVPKNILIGKDLEGRHKYLRCLPLASLFATHFKKNRANALGCNMAFWRSDLYAVNGYDEIYEGWGREDDDIAHRLHRLGLQMRDVRFAALCAHLWHPENSRADMERNVKLCESQDNDGVIRAEKGLDQYILHRSIPLR